MAQRIKLHGGPWHGNLLDLPEGTDHFHVVTPKNPTEMLWPASGPESETPAEIELKEGTYSRVGSTSDFEWDGWIVDE